MAFMLEMTGGRLPFWLASTQVKILTINNQPDTLDYIKEITDLLSEQVLMKPLKYNELRVQVDSRNESLGKKIREAELEKVPLLMIIGPKDIENRQVSVRTQAGESAVLLSELPGFLQTLV
jgi:threonyl-tRNA synthetase